MLLLDYDLQSKTASKQSDYNLWFSKFHMSGLLKLCQHLFPNASYCDLLGSSSRYPYIPILSVICSLLRSLTDSRWFSTTFPLHLAGYVIPFRLLEHNSVRSKCPPSRIPGVSSAFVLCFSYALQFVPPWLTAGYATYSFPDELPVSSSDVPLCSLWNPDTCVSWHHPFQCSLCVSQRNSLGVSLFVSFPFLTRSAMGSLCRLLHKT